MRKSCDVSLRRHSLSSADGTDFTNASPVDELVEYCRENTKWCHMNGMHQKNFPSGSQRIKNPADINDSRYVAETKDKKALNPKPVQKELDATHSIIELARKTLAQSASLATPYVLQDLLKKCKVRERTMQVCATEAVEIGELDTFHHVCKVLDSLRLTIDELNSYSRDEQSLTRDSQRPHITKEKGQLTKCPNDYNKEQSNNTSHEMRDVSKSNAIAHAESHDDGTNHQLRLFTPDYGAKKEFLSHTSWMDQFQDGYELQDHISPHKMTTNREAPYPWNPTGQVEGSKTLKIDAAISQSPEFMLSQPRTQNVLSQKTVKHSPGPSQDFSYAPPLSIYDQGSFCQYEAKEVLENPKENNLQDHLTSCYNTEENKNSRRETERLGHLLEKNEMHMAHLENELKMKQKRIEQLETLLNTSHTEMQHAKDMWMQESSRASQLYSEIKALEEALLRKDNQIVALSKRYERAQNELHVLNSVVMRENHECEISSSHTPLSIINKSKMRTQRDITLKLGDDLEESDEHAMQLFTQPQTFSSDLKYPMCKSRSQSIHVASPQLKQFRRLQHLLHGNEGIIYESPILQICLKAFFNGLKGSIHLLYNNRVHGALHSLQMTLHYDAHLKNKIEIICGPLPEEIRSKEHVTQSLAIRCLEPYEGFPLLRLSFLLSDASPHIIQFFLPIPVTKFMQGQNLSSQDFFDYWKHKDFLLREVTAFITLDQCCLNASRLAFVRAIQYNGALTLLPYMDKDQNSFLFAGMFSASSESETPAHLVLIQYRHVDLHQAKSCSITVRSNSFVLSRALKSLLTLYLSHPLS